MVATMAAVPITSCCAMLSLLLISFLHLALLLIVHAQDQLPNNPSTAWSLSDYYNTSDNKYAYKFSNFTLCNNASTNLALLNDDEGLYARYLDVQSAHSEDSTPYAVYFHLCFVITTVAAESACLANNVSYYLSLVAVNGFGKVKDPNKGQIVWTANTNKPVSKNACLQLGDDSNLKLVEYYDNIRSPDVVWETNTTGQAFDASLGFTFEGNMVLFSNTTNPPFEPLWQSHQHPTDTLMVLQVLQKNSTLSVHNSATSLPPKSGNYTMVIENGCVVLYARIGQHGEETQYGSPYWVWSNSSAPIDTACASGHDDDGISFVALCWDTQNQLQLYAGYHRSEADTEISPANCSSMHHDGILEPIIRIETTNATSNVTYATLVKLEADGDLHAYTVSNTTYKSSTAVWSRFYTLFQDRPCQLPLYCGFYGKCDQHRKDNHCTCDRGFEFNDASNVRLGCKLKNDSNQRQWQLPTNGTLITIAKDETVDFITLHDVDYFSINFTDLHSQPNDISYKESDNSSCKQRCRNDSSCTAAFWNGGASTCFLVRGQVGTIQNGSMLAYIKYVRPTKKALQHWIVIGPVLAAATLAFLTACMYLYIRRRNLAMRFAELEKERSLLSLLGSDSPSRFSWKEMHEYTCGFSEVLGSGGFGSVFRGSLPDGTAIAVKQLDADGSSGQGNKEFIAEVSILSQIHHAHLVRLIGFCLEGAKRLLVYEFMENGSLDSWLFRGPVVTTETGRKEVLSWKTRFQIALGTSKGLAYLHEECQERVIHMDFKPQNILLGRDFVPKISDFGMSRRIDRDQSSVMTLMRGTPGYLAPEWLLDCAVTEKCDVYSFGIVLLEMVSGRKVKDLRELKQKLRMRSLKESVMMGHLDDHLKYSYYDIDVKEEEVVRMVEIALLCVRKDPVKRPAMSSVALMLEGKAEVQGPAMDAEDDDGDGEKELLMYPSAMNRTMRSMGSFSGSSARLTSVFGEGSGSHNYRSWTTSTSEGRKKKKSMASSFYSESEGALDSDALLTSL